MTEWHQRTEDLGKDFAARLLVMVQTRLVTSRHTIPWSDEIIQAQDEPPDWITELCLKTHKRHVEAVIADFLRSPPHYECENLTDFHIACYFLRYSRRELSWASFLDEVGKYSDATNATPDCSHWYSMLNELEDSEFDEAVEKRQVAETRPLLARATGETSALLQPLLEARGRKEGRSPS